MDTNGIKLWLSKNRVCFVTNSMMTPSTLFLSSLKTYIDFIPIQNFWAIPGVKDGIGFYGLQAFMHMLNYMLSYDRFDYVVYIDEDCFITNATNLAHELERFMNSGCCIGGPQDGGVICHRNHSSKLINTFLSFWNIKLMKNKGVTIQKINDYIESVLKEHLSDSYQYFLTMLEGKPELNNIVEVSSKIMLDKAALYRKTCNEVEPEYCNVIRNDSNNSVEPTQEPYTYDDATVQKNFEPYYILQEAIVLISDAPIYYMFAGDLYSDMFVKNNEQFDLSGMTSVIWSQSSNIQTISKNNMIAVHTWYSRSYTKWPSNQKQLEQTKRINTIIKNFSSLSTNFLI